MGERRGTKGLELWCRRMTEGYPGVQVKNMTTSWRDGLAFCAIIHHFRPDLIDFAKLSKDDIYYNNDLAFQTAERHLGIPALLEPEDMVEYPIPDRLSILTYLSQFYQTFVVAQGSPSRIVPKRPANATDRGVVSPTSTSPTSKMLKAGGGRARREPCAKCGLPVFIAERLNVGKHLYHRTCFRCARCNSQLTLANYYETETEGQFCCETCPDEEQLKQNLANSETAEKLALSRSLSDEEKSAGILKFDDYSYKFETALEDPADESLSKNYTLSGEQSLEFANARSQFITSQLAAEESEGDSSEDDVPDLPQSDPPILPKSDPPSAWPKTKIPDLEVDEDSENSAQNKSEDLSSRECRESADSGCPSHLSDSFVHSNVKLSEVSDKSQPVTAIRQLGVNKIVTKENKFPSGDSETSSLVKLRMRLFEDKFSGDQNEQLKKRPRSNKDIHKSAETKFTPSNKVPSEDEETEEEEKEEEQSSTGLDSVKVESHSSVNLVESFVGNDYNIENSLAEEEEQKKRETQTKQNKSMVDLSAESIILISDTSQEEASSSNKDSIIEIFDSSIDNNASSLPTTEAVSKNGTESPPPMVETSSEALQYPDDLNPFDDDPEPSKTTEDESKSLNPFGDDDDDEDVRHPPKPAVRKKVKLKNEDAKIVGTNTDTPEHLAVIQMHRISYNPFDDEDDEEEQTQYQRKIHIPRISLNPFWKDYEEPDDDPEDEMQKPVPLPRKLRSTLGTPKPKPRKLALSIHSELSPGLFGSNTSLSSAHSSIGPAGRKKKQAPKPPSVPDLADSAHSSVASSPSPSVQHSPKMTPRVRKFRKAPLPPSTTSTPLLVAKPVDVGMTSAISSIGHNNQEPGELAETSPKDGGEWEKEKIIKDEVNRNRQSQITSPISSSENSTSLPVPNKSTYGKWKRRKGPAPSRPIPQRRNIKPLPVVEIKRELDLIEIQQLGLEKQGVRVEQMIREKSEGPNTDLDASLAPEVEDLILQLFELVNEKNALFRKQAELMYLRRQQRLEEDYADLEYQIRCLMVQPEANKTDFDKAGEEELINRLVEVVERRNEIVECLEMDRVREAEEDDSINNQLNLYGLKRDENTGSKSNLSDSKQKKKNKKEKKFKFKSGKKMDIDKDIDECESSSTSLPVKDKKKKKKFNIF